MVLRTSWGFSNWVLVRRHLHPSRPPALPPQIIGLLGTRRCDDNHCLRLFGTNLLRISKTASEGSLDDGAATGFLLALQTAMQLEVIRTRGHFAYERETR